jgi:hypothetical protein
VRQSPGRKSTSSLNFSAMTAPQNGKLPGLRHQHLVAGLQRIDEGASQAPVPDGRVDMIRLLGPKHPLHRRQHGVADLGEFRTPVVHGRHVHGAQQPGPARWSVPESAENAFHCARSCGVLPGLVLAFASRSNITIWRACPPPATAVNA